MSDAADREAFEAWFTRNDDPETARQAIERDAEGEYKLASAYLAWKPWHAALAWERARIEKSNL